MDSAIRKFSFSRRARAVVARFVKGVELPPTCHFTVTRKQNFWRKLFRRPTQEDGFRFSPNGWRAISVGIKRSRIYLDFWLASDLIRVGGKSRPHWNVANYEKNPRDILPGGLRSFWMRGVDAGVGVIPLNAQQMSYLLGRPSEAGWGVVEDLEELKRAPDGLFCSFYPRVGGDA